MKRSRYARSVIALPLVIALLVLVACGAPTAAPTTAPVAEMATALPTATTVVPPATPAPTATATAEPTTTPAPTVTAQPTATLAPTVTPSPQPVGAALPGTRYRTVQSSDGFIAVREQPTTSSDEMQRLPAGGEVVCVSFVDGEQLTLLGVTSNQWADCPDVGGYIFAPLLLNPSAAPPPPAAASPNDRDAIIAAVRAHIGNPGFTSTISEPCVDREHALTVVTADGGAADTVAALLRRGAAGWEVIYFGPGMILIFPEELVLLGIPVDFAC